MNLLVQIKTGTLLGIIAIALSISGLLLAIKALPLENSGVLKTPLFDYRGEGIIYFGNSTIKVKNGGGLVVIDHQTFKPVIKIERKLVNYFLFKKDQLLVSGSFWDDNNNEIIQIEQNKWKADPNKMWNAKITNDSIKIYGSDPKQEPIFYCAIIDEKTIEVECKSRVRDLYFSATKDGLTVNDMGFKNPMVFDAKEYTTVVFKIGGPTSPISFEADGPGFYVKGFTPPVKGSKIGRFTAILVAPKKEIIDWKNRTKVMPDVKFFELINSSFIIGKVPDSNKVIWNTVIYNIEYNKKSFMEIIMNLPSYLGITYEEAQANHPDIMAWALNCEVEIDDKDGKRKIRKKMAEIKADDKVINKNLIPHGFLGFEQ